MWGRWEGDVRGVGLSVCQMTQTQTCPDSQIDENSSVDFLMAQIYILCFDFILYHQMEYLGSFFQHMQVPFTTHTAATWWVHSQLAHTHTHSIYAYAHTWLQWWLGITPARFEPSIGRLWRELVPLLPPEHHTYYSRLCTPSLKLLSHDKSDWSIWFLI